MRSEAPKPSEKPKPSATPKPKPKPIRFHCEFCGRDGHLEEFCWRRKKKERMAREFENRDRYRPFSGEPRPRATFPRSEAFVRTIPPRGARGSSSRGRGEFGGEFARRPPPRGFGRYDRSFESRGEFRPRFPPRGARAPPVRRERAPPMGSGNVDFANPSFEQMARHWFSSFMANPSVESFAHSRSRF